MTPKCGSAFLCRCIGFSDFIVFTSKFSFSMLLENLGACHIITRVNLQKWSSRYHKSVRHNRIRQHRPRQLPGGLWKLQRDYGITASVCRRWRQKQILHQRANGAQQAGGRSLLFHSNECEQSEFFDHARSHHKSAEHETDGGECGMPFLEIFSLTISQADILSAHFRYCRWLKKHRAQVCTKQNVNKPPRLSKRKIQSSRKWNR